MKNLKLIAILLLYCIPYSFTALYCDRYYRMVIIYLIALIMPLILARIMHKMGYKHTITLFSGVNAALSLWLSSVYLAEVSYYFKPFDHTSLIGVLCIIPWIINFFLYKLYEFPD